MKRRAIVLSKVLVVAPIVGIGGGTAWYFWPTAAPTSLLVAAPADVDAALRMSGINPQTLAAAGVTGPQTTALFQNASVHLNDALAALRAADTAVESARRDVNTLERVVVAGTSTQEQRSALATARAALATATTSRTTALNALVTAATADLLPERVAALSAIRTNAANWDQPTQYLVVERTEAARVELREALAAVRIAGEQGADPDQAAVNIVNTWNADGSVAAATTSLSTNLPAVSAAWAAAMAP